MSCSLSIFSCVQDVNRVISLLSDTTSRKDKPSPTEREGLIEPADSKGEVRLIFIIQSNSTPTSLV